MPRVLDAETIEVGSGRRVARNLSTLIAQLCKPDMIVPDNRTEFTRMIAD